MSDRDGRRICVTGGRDFSDRNLVEKALRDIALSPDDTLVEGEARGADKLCATVAREMGATVEPHPAQWRRYGNGAGHMRNAEMLNSGVDLLLSFPGGRGTRHCTNLAREMGIPVMLIRTDSAPSYEVMPTDDGDSPAVTGEPMPESQLSIPLAEENPWESLLHPRDP